jgi:hypothetical protein
MKYTTIEKSLNDKVEKIIAEGNIKEVSALIIEIAMFAEDSDWAEDICLRLATHENANIRGNAILGFGHIGRVHRKLNEAKVKPLIKAALTDKDEYVRGHAHCAKDDTKWFLKWKY